MAIDYAIERSANLGVSTRGVGPGSPLDHIACPYKDKRYIPFKVDWVPDRFELFILADDEKKVVEKEETRVPNTAVFTFNKEDHTLGNLLSQRLLRDSRINFSAYKVPHPLFATFELRISTDGSITPKQALIGACRDIVADLETLKSSFNTEWINKTVVNAHDRERGGDAGY